MTQGMIHNASAWVHFISISGAVEHETRTEGPFSSCGDAASDRMGYKYYVGN